MEVASATVTMKWLFLIQDNENVGDPIIHKINEEQVKSC